jgi:hypothetical protein
MNDLNSVLIEGEVAGWYDEEKTTFVVNSDRYHHRRDAGEEIVKETIEVPVGPSKYTTDKLWMCAKGILKPGDKVRVVGRLSEWTETRGYGLFVRAEHIEIKPRANA